MSYQSERDAYHMGKNAGLNSVAWRLKGLFDDGILDPRAYDILHVFMKDICYEDKEFCEQLDRIKNKEVCE